MSNTTSDPLIVTITLIQQDLVRYSYPIILVFGNIGSFLNILVLTQRVYLEKPSSCYILASTVNNILFFCSVVVFRFLATGFGIDLTVISLSYCVFQAYMANVTTSLSRIYLVLACVDRWSMSSRSVQLRSFNQMKVAKILIPSIAIFWFVISIHIIINNSIIGDQCRATTTSYGEFYNIYNVILHGISLPSLMLIFVVLTVRNIKLTRQRVNPQINQNLNVRNNARARENGLTTMIVVQLIVFVVTSLPYPMYLLYSVVTMHVEKSNVQIVLDRFYATIGFTFAYLNYGGTFYLYILTTRVFRKDLKKLLLKNRLSKLCCRTEENAAGVTNGANRNTVNQM